MSLVIVRLLALAWVVAWTLPVHALDDAERIRVVDADLAREKAKRTLDDATDAVEKADESLKKKLGELDTKVGEQKSALEKLNGADAEQKQSIKDASEAVRDCEQLGTSTGSEALGKVVASWLEKLDKAVSSLDGVEVAKDARAALDEIVSKELPAREENVKDLEKLEKELATATEEHESATKAHDKARADYLDAIKPARFLKDRLRSARTLRCLTAYCFGGVGPDKTKYAVEPVLDLPVGLVWSAGGGALPAYINSHTVNVEFNAGLRFWFGYDILSVMVYFSRPLIVGDEPIRLSGSPFEHPPARVRRPFPSLGIGFAGDVVLLGISYDQLHNGATDDSRDWLYPPNAVLSRSLTFSLGFSLFNTAKNAAGAAAAPAEESP